MNNPLPFTNDFLDKLYTHIDSDDESERFQAIVNLLPEPVHSCYTMHARGGVPFNEITKRLEPEYNITAKEASMFFTFGQYFIAVILHRFTQHSLPHNWYTNK